MKMSTYQRIAESCAKKGVSINQICRTANVERSTLERWKKREPNTLRILWALEKAIKDYAPNGSDVAEGVDIVVPAIVDSSEAITATNEDKWL